MHTGRVLQTLHAVNSLNSLAKVRFSPDGRVLVGDNNGQLEVWERATGGRPRVLGVSGQSISDFEFSPHGSEIVTASENGIITIRAMPDYRVVRSINACPSANTASFSPDGRQIVVACGDGSAPVFDAATGQRLMVISAANTESVNSAMFSPDGKSIITASAAEGTGYVQIWNSELANLSLPALYRVAEQRITGNLTQAERDEYLTGIG